LSYVWQVNGHSTTLGLAVNVIISSIYVIIYPNRNFEMKRDQHKSKLKQK
jgi:hypothetical protein